MGFRRCSRDETSSPAHASLLAERSALQSGRESHISATDFTLVKGGEAELQSMYVGAPQGKTTKRDRLNATGCGGRSSFARAGGGESG